MEYNAIYCVSEIGETRPICKNGEVIESGGCNTCDNCGAQLQCGL